MTILVLHDNPVDAHGLLRPIIAAGGDVVLAESRRDALQRLAQFRFTAAVLASPASDDTVATALRGLGVPYIVPTTSDLNDVVPTREGMLYR